jgi:LysM repeat protein
MAVSPPVQLAAEKQRRLCLVDRHVDCATYDAAVASHHGTAHVTGTRAIARMTPVILDHGRFELRLPALRADRAAGQVALVAVLAVAFLAIVLTRPATELGANGSPGPAETAAAAASAPNPTHTPAVASEPPVTPTPVVTDGPETPSPTTASAPPSAAGSEPVTSGATYKVKSGDTLSGIAARFGTTTRVLVQLNGITDPSRLRVGQVIKLP